MSDDHKAIVPAESVAVVDRDVDDLHPMVRQLTGRDLDAETMERLMALQERHEANTARKIFNDARARLLDDLPEVVAKNRVVDYTSRKTGVRTQYNYADLPQIMSAVMPALRQHGFSVSWTSDREGHDEVVTCHLLHRCGHSATNTRRASVESRPGQSGVQAAQSTVTYLQRHSLLALLGIVTGDMPDADEAPKEHTQAVDVARNLRARAKLRKMGIDPAEAEEHLGKVARDWTDEDLARLSTWVESMTAPQEGDDG